MIEINNLSKAFKDGSLETYEVLKECNLTINDEENVLITGENGAGKTTLFKIIGLMDKNYSGDYYIDEVNVQDLKNKEFSSMRNNMFGIVFQDFFLIEDETVRDNISVPLYYSKKFNLKQKKNRIEDVVEFLELKNIINKKVKHLSGGERQKVSIARAIANEPDILLMDEPTNALSLLMKEKLKTFIKDYAKKNKSVILISHDREYLEMDLFTKYRMEDGKLIKL